MAMTFETKVFPQHACMVTLILRWLNVIVHGEPYRVQW